MSSSAQHGAGHKQRQLDSVRVDPTDTNLTTNQGAVQNDHGVISAAITNGSVPLEFFDTFRSALAQSLRVGAPHRRHPA